MSRRGAFERILASLHEAMLDDTRWPATTALIEDACGIGKSGSALVVGEGGIDNARVWFARAYSRGERRQDLEREYFEHYYPHDERVPRIRGLPDSRLVHIPSLYTKQELKTSLAYNEGLRRTGGQNGLNVRLDGPRGSRIVWAISNPIATSGWGSSQIKLIERLLPHIRQFVRVRQALTDADVLSASFTDMLHATGFGIVCLDRCGRIVEVNDRALDMLRRQDGLVDHGGRLSAWLPADNTKLQGLLDAAIPPFGDQGVGRSMTVGRSANLPRLVLHVHPVDGGRPLVGLPRVAALVLVVEPESRPRLDAGLVSEALGLTRAESEVAVMLSEGRTVREIARVTDRAPSTVHDLIKRANKRQGISRQVDLVRLVLRVVELSAPRD